MPSLNLPPEKPGSAILPTSLNTTLEDHVQQIEWDASGQWFAAMPVMGSILVGNAAGQEIARLPGHGGGNSSIAWQPGQSTLATYGHDGEVRLHSAPFDEPPRVLPIGKGWAERLAWNCDGSLLAVALGRDIHVLDARTGERPHSWPDQKSTVADLVWNPRNSRELASVCDGGALLWRTGRTKPFARFDWGGASLLVSWSPGGRWIVTGDQTPSVHIYDVKHDTPLHIQGFQTKVKSFAWLREGKQLAVSGSRVITVWPCHGRKGPDGSTPVQLVGHEVDVTCLEASPKADALLSADFDGKVLLWMPAKSEKPGLLTQVDDEITSLRMAPSGDRFLTGTHNGDLTLHLIRRLI
ncbi:MAG: hypothetical protein ISQ14_05280 [Verrucomicrobiae bacterium]|nr:hypothetical protein [Verrucomicrobiae bacterium]